MVDDEAVSADNALNRDGERIGTYGRMLAQQEKGHADGVAPEPPNIHWSRLWVSSAFFAGRPHRLVGYRE